MADVDQRTVLVLGLSQQGKSKTISAILEGQNISEGGPVVGEGIASVTKAPVLYRVHQAGEATRVRIAKPWDVATALGDTDAYPELTRAIAEATVEGRDVVGDCDAQMAKHSRRVWDSFQHDISYMAKPELAGPLFSRRTQAALQIRFLDTPGLEATDGRDDENMAQVLEALVQGCSEVACVLLVTQVGAPFSSTWVQQVERYWLQFPPLRSRWVVVHTRAEPFGARSCEWAKQGSCFERDCFVRVQAANAHLRKVMGDDADSVRHVFMEHCLPGASEFRPPPGCEAMKHFQVKMQNALFHHIADFSPVPLAHLPYHKSRDMTHVDEKMLEWLRGRESATSQFHELCRTQLEAHTQNRDDRQREFDTRDNVINTLRQGGLAPFQSFVAERPRNFLTCSRTTHSQPVGVTYRKVEVETTKTRWYHANCKTEMVKNSQTSQWEVRITAPPFRSVRQRVRLLSGSEEVYQEDIQRMEEEKTGFEQQIAEANGQRLQVEVSIRHTERQLQHFQEMMAQITQDMTLAEYGKTKDFYVQARLHQWSGERCCRHFALVHSLELPMGLYNVA